MPIGKEILFVNSLPNSTSGGLDMPGGKFYFLKRGYQLKER
jgi:hypothetical protein